MGFTSNRTLNLLSLCGGHDSCVIVQRQRIASDGTGQLASWAEFPDPADSCHMAYSFSCGRCTSVGFSTGSILLLALDDANILEERTFRSGREAKHHSQGSCQLQVTIQLESIGHRTHKVVDIEALYHATHTEATYLGSFFRCCGGILGSAPIRGLVWTTYCLGTQRASEPHVCTSPWCPAHHS